MPSARWAQRDGSHHSPSRTCSPDAEPAGTLIVGVQPPEPRENPYLGSKPPARCLATAAEQMKAATILFRDGRQLLATNEHEAVSEVL